MKDFISTTYTFTPGASGVGTVNLSGITSFNLKLLVAVINQTRGVVIYATGSTATRYTAVTGSTLTLFVDTSTHSSGDILQVIYNDTTAAAAATTITTLGQDSAYSPKYAPPNTTFTKSTSVDTNGSLVTRGSVLTDESSTRVNFNGTSLALSLGTATVSGKIVTGISYNTSDVHPGDYFKFTADSETAWVQIASIDSFTQLTLVGNYVGASTGASERSLVQPFTATGGSVAVASGQATLTVPVTTNVRSAIIRLVDYGPLVFRAGLTISQRIGNQNIRIGLAENTVNSIQRWFARFRVDGANTFTVICESGSNPNASPSVAETESTTASIPNGLTTAANLDYRIEQTNECVSFFINGVLIAQHCKRIPTPYDLMAGAIILDNTGTTASSTNVVIDYMVVENHNAIKTDRLLLQPNVLVPFVYSLAAVIAINTDLLVINCEGFNSLFVQCLAMGTAGVVSLQWSNDGVNYATAPVQTFSNLPLDTITAAGSYVTRVLGKFVRIRMTTATTGGTTTFDVRGSQTYVNALANQLSTTTNVGARSEGTYTRFRNIAVAATVLTVKGTAGNIYGLNLVNTNATTACYFKLFDAATVTLGTTAPVEVIVVPANSVVFYEPKASAFSYHSNSIKIAATLTLVDSSTSNPATDLYVELKYI